MPILVAPTEPIPVKALGRSSSVPERFGADILLLPSKVGIQRKELSDLISSLHDGRLAQEMIQLQRLAGRVLIVEGRGRWTSDGELMSGFTQFSKQQLAGLLLSVQQRGVWVLTTDDVHDTVRAVREIEQWYAKDGHDSLARRPKFIVSPWGRPDNADYMAWVLQGVPGISSTLARRIVELYPQPIVWNLTAGDLERVKGIGKRKAESFIRALRTLNVAARETA